MSNLDNNSKMVLIIVLLAILVAIILIAIYVFRRLRRLRVASQANIISDSLGKTESRSVLPTQERLTEPCNSNMEYIKGEYDTACSLEKRFHQNRLGQQFPSYRNRLRGNEIQEIFANLECVVSDGGNQEQMQTESSIDGGNQEQIKTESSIDGGNQEQIKTESSIVEELEVTSTRSWLETITRGLRTLATVFYIVAREGTQPSVTPNEPNQDQPRPWAPPPPPDPPNPN